MVELSQSARARSENRIRVLFVMIQMQMGGAERMVLDLARGLARRGFAPAVAWFVENRPLPEFEELGIPLFHVPKGPGFDWNAMKRIARIVRDERIDLVNAHHFMPFVYAYYAAKITGRAKLVYTDHSDNDVKSAAGLWRLAGTCLVASSDAAVGVSPGVARTLRSQFPLRPQRIHAIENGVDITRFTRADGRRDIGRRRCGLSPTDLVVGIVANLKRNKNHLFLLRAFREVCRTRPMAKMLIVGQGFPGDLEDSQQEVAAFIEDNGLRGKVRMLGHQRDIPELLHAMDVFCLVSHREGLPVSAIEAMAAGLPVVGTDIDGLRAVVNPGINGLLVKPDDVTDLVRSLDRLLGDAELRRTMGDAAAQIATERYSLERCVAQTEALFRSVLPAARSAVDPAAERGAR